MPWSQVPTYVHRTASVEVTVRDGHTWLAGSCDTPDELREVAALLEYLAAEQAGAAKAP